MSKYTTEVRYICETYAGATSSVNYSSISDIIKKSRDKIFDFDYPIFDEGYKETLETKILKHYYTREIGAESLGLWKMWLSTRMNEIMPYYNQFYKLKLDEINWLDEINIHEVFAGKENGIKDSKINNTGTQETSTEIKNTGTQQNTSQVLNTGTQGVAGTTTDTGTTNTEGTNTHNNTHWDLYSDTPQGGINGIEGQGAVEGMYYLTNARKITDSSNDGDNHTTTNNLTKTDNYTATNDLKENATGTRTDNLKQENSSTRTDDLTQDIAEKNTNTNEYEKTTNGHNTDIPTLIHKMKKEFLNIDMLIIDELGDLFINLW